MAAPTALVTGGARRLGRALTVCLADTGWNVAVHYRNSDMDAELAVAECKSRGVQSAAVRADLRDGEAAGQLVGRAANAVGAPLTLLVNSASSFMPDSFLQPGSATDNLTVDLLAPMTLIGAFARQIPKADDANCCVVNILDAGAAHVTADFASYAVAKSGLRSLTRLAAIALAPRIRVNGIAPGPVLRGARESARHFERSWLGTPLGRGATPEEVERALLYLLSCPSVTGEVLTLDGGARLRSA